MAFDPEARENSNTAMILGVAALILIIGAVAYFATRPTPENQTIVVTPTSAPVTNTVIQEVPVTAAPDVIIVATPAPKIIERNTTTTIIKQATPVPDAPDSAGGTRGSNNTNVTVNVPPANNSAPKTNDANATVTEAAPVETPAAEPTLAPTASGY